MSEIAKALLAFQAAPPTLVKTQEGQIGKRRYMYLGLEDAMGCVLPLLNQAGIVVTQLVQTTNDRDRMLVTTLTHAESGENLTSMVLLPGTSDMQALGSAITYARRYSLLAMLGLVGEEDDDAAATVQDAQGGREKPSKPQRAGGQGDPIDPSTPDGEPLTAAAADVTVTEAARLRADQDRRYDSVMRDLRKMDPSQESYWKLKAKKHTQNKLHKTSRAQLDAAEYEDLIQHMKKLLEEQLAVRQ